MGLVLDNIPGLAEAVAAAEANEAAIRELPFFAQETDICGVPSKLFTLRHWMYLKRLKSPFLGYDTELGAVELCQFLWVVSPAFGSGNEARNELFKQVLTLDFAAAVKAVFEYVDHSFMDILSKAGGSDAPVTSFVASIIHRLAMTYGIGASGFTAFRNEILDLPLIELSQYRRHILMESGVRFGNVISGRVRREMVAKALVESRKKKAEESTQPEKKPGLLSSITNLFR